MIDQDYKDIADSLPHQPGVYRYISNSGEILYVGKAKNLKKRIASYFGSTKGMAFKTKTMVKHAARIEYTIVETEHDSLLLEATLIKKHQPRYNVMLKDGKSYVYICVKKERFPRVFFTRRVIKDGSTYFGPYTSKHRANIILELILKIFPLRNCNFNLSEKNIENNKFKVCLEYHIKRCQAPCVGYESEETYNAKISQIKNILKGHFKPVKDYIKDQMHIYAEKLDFEMAQRFKEKLTAFTDYQANSMVVSVTVKDVDVFSIATDDDMAFINYLKVIDGTLVKSEMIQLKKNLNEEESDLLGFAINLTRERYGEPAPEILLPFEVALLDTRAKMTIPTRGDKKKLLELSQKNVKYFVFQKEKERINRSKRENSVERILKTIQKDLNMDVLPKHIECFDNSNFHGTNPVASCVVFKNAKPSKKDYRRFHIKTVIGANDFASMEEVVGRRYRRLVKEQADLPQLIIIDGGKGQLSSAVKILTELGIMDKILVVGIAKQLEEIYFPGDSVPLHINKKSESLKVIQHLRNEAHRFAITFHRDLRSKDLIKSEITQIKGIGDKTAQRLLTYFGSVKGIKKANHEEWEAVVGKSTAIKIKLYFDSIITD